MFFKMIIPAAEKETGRTHLNGQYSAAVPALSFTLVLKACCVFSISTDDDDGLLLWKRI